MFLLVVLTTCLFANSLSLEDNGDGTWNVGYTSADAIGGFQFNVDGASVVGASGGDAAANDMQVYAQDGNRAISFSFSGSSIPAGSGILTNLDVTITSTENLCLKNTVISDPSGAAINSCPEYWQLTCIDVP